MGAIRHMAGGRKFTVRTPLQGQTNTARADALFPYRMEMGSAEAV